MAKTKKHQINPAMHYTVVVALIISLVTTFLLGVLLTETLFGGGLGYFSDYARDNKIEQRREAFYNNIRQQIETQGASAAQLGGSNRPIHFGSNFGDSLNDRPIKLPTPPKPGVTTINFSWVYQDRIFIYFEDVKGEDYYRIERYDSRYPSNGWQVVGTSPYCDWEEQRELGYGDCISSGISYEDYTAEITWPAYPSWNYEYRVIAVNGSGETPSSNTEEVIPFYDSVAPDTPQNFHVVSNECTFYNGAFRTLTVYEWDRVYTDNPEQGAVGITSYHLYKATNANPGGFVFGLPDDETTTWTDYTVGSNNTTTFDRWIVSADANSNESAPSERVTIVVPPC